MPTISDQHIHEQNKILKQQLEEMSEQANEYADRLTRAEAREIDLRSKMKTVSCIAVMVMLVTGAVPCFEPPRGKTNNVVSEQVRHKPTCTATEKS